MIHFATSIFAFSVFLLEFLLFTSVWLLVFWGVFLCIRSISQHFFRSSSLHSVHNGAALVGMSSVLFQMMRMYGSLRTQREVAMLRGPPLSCKMSFLARLLLSESCESYWSSANGSLFWHLNPLSVIASLLAELLGTMGVGIGGFAGGFVRSLLDKLPWIYHLPALLLVLVAVLTAIAFAYGYQFVIGYGLVRVSPTQSAKSPRKKEFDAMKPLPPLPKKS